MLWQEKDRWISPKWQHHSPLHSLYFPPVCLSCAVNKAGDPGPHCAWAQLPQKCTSALNYRRTEITAVEFNIKMGRWVKFFLIMPSAPSGKPRFPKTNSSNLLLQTPQNYSSPSSHLQTWYFQAENWATFHLSSVHTLKSHIYTVFIQPAAVRSLRA